MVTTNPYVAQNAGGDVTGPKAADISLETAADARSRYLAGSLRLVQIRNFVDDTLCEHVSQFLRNGGGFAPIYGLYGKHNGPVGADVWSAADEARRLFWYERLSGPGPNATKEGSAALLTLRQLLASASFFDFVQHVTGEQLGPITEAHVQRFRQGHYLRKHHDRDGHRKIAFILYLSRDWEKRFGGQLIVTKNDGANHVIEPEYNSLVLFDVAGHDNHYIEPLTSYAKDNARDTISGWMASSDPA